MSDYFSSDTHRGKSGRSHRGTCRTYALVSRCPAPASSLYALIKPLRPENSHEKTGAAYAIPVLFLLGLLCGYPLGAKMASDFTKEGYIKPSTATILLPLCNNISPMFLSGYIGHTVLQDRFPFWFLLVVLYVPYVLVTSIVFLVFM